MRKVPVYPYGHGHESPTKPLYWTSPKEAHRLVEETRRAVFLSRRGEPMAIQLCTEPKVAHDPQPRMDAPFAGSARPVSLSLRDMRVNVGEVGGRGECQRVRSKLKHWT
jgi:hypothetical protein